MPRVVLPLALLLLGLSGGGCVVAALPALLIHDAGQPARNRAAERKVGKGLLIGQSLVAVDDIQFEWTNTVERVPRGTIVQIVDARVSAGGIEGNFIVRVLEGVFVDPVLQPGRFDVTREWRPMSPVNVPEEIERGTHWELVPEGIRTRADLDVWTRDELAASDDVLLARLTHPDRAVAARAARILTARACPGPEALATARHAFEQDARPVVLAGLGRLVDAWSKQMPTTTP